MPAPTVSDIVPAAQETPPASEPVSPELPEEILSIPAFAGLLHGAPPAVYTGRSQKTPEVEAVIKNIKPLEQAGFGIYNSQDGKLAVLYNGAFVSQDEIQKADKAGKLTEIVPSLDSVSSQFGSAISGEAPAPGAALPGAPVAPAAGGVAPAPAGAPPSARVQNTLATARVKALQVGSPTSGPKPGSGRLINNILSPVV